MTALRLAFLLMALCAVAAWQITVIPESLMQMTVGPVLAPAAIVGALSLVAALYGVSAWRGRQVDVSQEPGQEPLPVPTPACSACSRGVRPSSCWSFPWGLCCLQPCAAC